MTIFGDDPPDRDPPAMKYLAEFLDEHITDEKARAEGHHLLRQLRRERKAFALGVRVTLDYMLEHNKLPQGKRPQARDEICRAPDFERTDKDR
jgi:hypothetical protein